MIALKYALKEYYKAMTITKNPVLCWDGRKYVVSWFFSKNQCEKLGWEVIL